MPVGQIGNEVQRFRDHHTAHRKLMADWDAAWRTWCGNYAGFNKGNGNAAAPRRSNQQVIRDFLDKEINSRGSGPSDQPDLQLIPGRREANR